MMTSGFSLVLYSRLYLIASGSKILKAVFWMIIIDGIVFHTPVIVSGAVSGPIGARLYVVTSHLEVSLNLQLLSFGEV
jgi:Sec-independent protein secretion pathway component TatC